MTTIRQHLTRSLLLAAAALVAAGSVTVYLCARTALQGQFDAGMRAKAQALAALTEFDGRKVEMDFSPEQMPAFGTGGNEYFELRLADGTLVQRSRSLGDAPLPSPADHAARSQFWNVVLPDGRSGRAFSHGFGPAASEGGSATPVAAQARLVVAAGRGELDRTLATLGWVLFGCGFLLLTATGLIVPRLLGRALAPLQHFADHATRIDAASLSTRFPQTRLPAELVPISARLNELLARLEDSFERERRFTSDVAHEFRTPIAELRALAELAIRMPEARAANADQEVLSIAMHLERVLTQLLALARGEHNQLNAQSVPVRVEPLVGDVCQGLQAQASARHVELTWHAPQDREIVSDPALLRSILANVVGNAVEYTPPGGKVSVDVHLDDHRFETRVTNTVEDFRPEDVQRLFDRFWRKDSARAGNGHIGLGLSIAQTLARALGGELTARLVAPDRLELKLVGFSVRDG